MTNELVLLLMSSDPFASARLSDVAKEFSRVRVWSTGDIEEFWSSLRDAARDSLGVMVVCWDASADFVRALKADSLSSPIPVIACLHEAPEAEVDALYDAGANCVVELDGDHSADRTRLRDILEFWSCSATLPRGSRSAFAS